MKEAVAVSEEGAKMDCSSCKESEFVAMPCNHVFHKKCLGTNNVCPLCGHRMHVEEELYLVLDVVIWDGSLVIFLICQ